MVNGWHSIIYLLSQCVVLCEGSYGDEAADKEDLGSGALLLPI